MLSWYRYIINMKTLLHQMLLKVKTFYPAYCKLLLVGGCWIIHVKVISENKFNVTILFLISGICTLILRKGPIKYVCVKTIQYTGQDNHSLCLSCFFFQLCVWNSFSFIENKKIPTFFPHHLLDVLCSQWYCSIWESSKINENNHCNKDNYHCEVLQHSCKGLWKSVEEINSGKK